MTAALLIFLVVISVFLIRMRDLFSVVMLLGVFSLIAASLFVFMDAADVALTEAAVGAGVSTLLLLKTLGLTETRITPPKRNSWGSLVAVMLVGGVLIYGTLDITPYGVGLAENNQHVTAAYLNQSMSQTGVPNVVTSILASYRGFDTMGELFVIFTASIGVLAVLSVARPETAASRSLISEHLVLRVIAKILIPLIMTFAFYVQFHGEYSPGGGFQAGVIFASSMILYTMLFGNEAARQVLNERATQVLAFIGLTLFAGTGVLTMLLGGEFLNYSALAQDPVQGQLWGILVVELGVGFTVAALIYRIYLEFDYRQQAPQRQVEK